MSPNQTPQLEAIEDTVHFLSGSNQYVKTVPNVYDALDLTGDGQLGITSDDGEVCYLIHRDGGPAIEQPGMGRTRYVWHGLLHRLDGPADIQLASDDIEAYESHWVFGMPVEAEALELHQDFFKRAEEMILKNQWSVLECDFAATEDVVVHSFESLEDLDEAIERNALRISCGPRDAQETKWVDLPAPSSGGGVAAGLAILGLLGGGLLLANRAKTRTNVQAQPAYQGAARV